MCKDTCFFGLKSPNLFYLKKDIVHILKPSEGGDYTSRLIINGVLTSKFKDVRLWIEKYVNLNYGIKNV